MSTKIKKVTVNAFENAVKANKETGKTIEWNGLEIAVKHQIGLEDMLSFVDSVYNNCFNEDGAYIPEIKDFSFRDNIIEKYTNISLPSNVSQKYNLLYGTDIIDIIVDYIDKPQFNAIIKAIDAKVENSAQANISAVVRQVNDMEAAINDIAEHVKNTLGEDAMKEMSTFAKAFLDGKVDEKMMLQAYRETLNKEDSESETATDVG